MTQKKAKAVELPIKLFKNQDAWTRWLHTNHAKAPGIWLQFARKASGISAMNYAEAIESALCYGWINGQARSFDEKTWLQRFTPRRPRSPWSKINVGKATALIESGRMQPAGLAAINAAQADGRWDSAYQSWSSTEVPSDLQTALDANPKANTFFGTLSGKNRYAIIFRVSTAGKPDTRARRVAKFVAMCEKGETVYEPEEKPASKTATKKKTAKKR